MIGVPEEEDKTKGHDEILEEIIVETFPKMRKERATQAQETQNPEQDKPKEKKKHINQRTHINQINEAQTQRANIKSIKEKATNNTQGDSHKDYN